ncbi:PIR Superfamily Protein [Plasmodium ovale wallikeri]|uniref:PIR Superfamily Protein n=1 Tax=Plasmodium ovale wallikeri TaxID=864142 RepID=A0A1A9AKJ9_PLAOA|nr:PIR Superfamily Protein [Plasmodium ovale wallikeri]SBT59002.1 PIR Superfamily Protein [Plasmodium ovale wallikeri]
MGDGKTERGSAPIDLPTENFYNDMKKEYPSLAKYTSPCYTNIVDNNINNIKNICKRILRYLENNTVWKNINSVFDVLQTVRKHPIEKVERINYYQKCKPNMNIDNYEDWKERRNLYEYYVNFDTLSKTAHRFDNVCEAYYKKIEGTKSLYKYFENKCSSDKYDLQELWHWSSSYNTDPTSERSDIGTKVGHSVLGVASYTPMGSWIRKVGGTNTNSIGDMDEFSSYTQESGDMFLGDTGNYISYQPM